MAAWKGKTRGGLTGYKIFIAILKNLGLPFAYLLLYFVAFYFFVFAEDTVHRPGEEVHYLVILNKKKTRASEHALRFALWFSYNT